MIDCNRTYRSASKRASRVSAPRPTTRARAASGRGSARSCCALAAAVATVLASSGSAAPPAQAGRVLIVRTSEAAPYAQAEAVLKARLAKQGHALQSVLLAEHAKAANAKAPETDVCVAVGTGAAGWLHENLQSKTALVYCMVSDPKGLGLLEDPRASGVSVEVPVAAQFRLMAEALPNARSVGMLYRSDTPASAALLEKARRAAPKGFRLEAIAVDRHKSVADAINALLARNVEIVWTAPDASVYSVPAIRSLLLASIRRKTPVFGFSPACVRAGALLGVGIDPGVQGGQAADVAERILERQRQRRSGEEVEPLAESRRFPPPRFRTAVNLIVARELAVSLPKALIERATDVFGENGEAEK